MQPHPAQPPPGKGQPSSAGLSQLQIPLFQRSQVCPSLSAHSAALSLPPGAAGLALHQARCQHRARGQL